MKNVRDFGAVGDGKVNDTAALQRALDGGGTIRVPGGRYLTGTLYLGSDTTLELDDDATLVGSPDIADYNAVDFCPQNRDCPAEKASGRHLIVALEADHVTLRGGRIDGNRAAFFDPHKCWRDDFSGWRPSQMLYFCESNNIRIEGVELINAPYWACYIYGCDNVFVDRVRIFEDDRDTWNGDGIDIDCCKNVVVANCNIASADDSLTVRASAVKHLQRHDGITENVVVTNCILASREAAIRIGVGTGTIRNCTFSNLVMHDTSYGICINSCYAPQIFPSGARGVDIENLLFSDIVMDLRVPILISSTWQENPAEKSGNFVRGLVMRGIRAIARDPVYMQGNPDFNHTDITLADSTFELIADECCRSPHELFPQFLLQPCGFFVNNMKDLTLKNVVLRWRGRNTGYEKALDVRDSPNLRLIDCELAEPEK